jgi:SAM-dependent methyltransferase
VRTALGLYGAALRQAAAGGDGRLDLLDPPGRMLGQFDAGDWTGGLRLGDRALLGRCRGATLDIGCGPGRLAAAVMRDGRTALGVDISPEAVRQTRRRGALAWHGDVFDELPREGAWSTVLLADGNIGIGGDPHRLLRRCGELLRPGGVVLAELQPPGTVTWAGTVRLKVDQAVSQPFPWATLAAHEVAEVAHRVSFGVRTLWTEAGRWFAELSS